MSIDVVSLKYFENIFTKIYELFITILLGQLI